MPSLMAGGIQGAIPYETIQVTLAPGEIRAVPKSAAYISVLSATDGQSVLVSFNGASFFNLPPGIALSDFYVPEFWFQNSSGAPNTIVIATGMATLRDNRIVFDVSSPLPVTLPANQSINLAQVLGTNVTVNAGAATAGTLRVVLATGSPVNLGQVNGTTVSVNTGAADAGCQRVALANNSPVNVAQYGGTNVVNGGTSGLVGVGGPAAHSAAASANPLRSGGKVVTAVDTTLVNNDMTDSFHTSGGAQVVHPYSVPDVSWQYAAAAGGIVNTTTAVTVKAAAAAGIRNYVAGLDLSWDALTNATEFCIRDGAAGTVIYRCKLPNGAAGRMYVQFAVPLRGTAATLLEVVTLTASGAGGVWANLNGFTAP